MLVVQCFPFQNKKTRSCERALKMLLSFPPDQALAVDSLPVSGVLASVPGVVSSAAGAGGVKSTHSKIARCAASPCRWFILTMRVYRPLRSLTQAQVFKKNPQPRPVLPPFLAFVLGELHRRTVRVQTSGNQNGPIESWRACPE